MTLFRARAAEPAHVEPLRALCSLAATSRDSLLAARQADLEPEDWLTKRWPSVVIEDASVPIAFGLALPERAPMGAARCAELLLFVTPTQRRRGAARAALHDLLMACRLAGLWKVVAFAWPEDVASRTLLDHSDFRTVGTLVKHVHLDSGWHDVVLYERLVMAARKSMPSIPGV